MPTGSKKVGFGGDFTQMIHRHKDDPLRTGFQSLPPGLKGTAVLTVCELREAENGTTFFYAEATIESPETFMTDEGRVKIKGKQTRQYIYASDDPEEQEGRAARITETLRKLGGADFIDQNEGSDLEQLCAALMEKGEIRFSYSTSMGKASGKTNPKTGKPYEPRVSEWWNGTDDVPERNGDEFSSGKFLDNTGAGKSSANGVQIHKPSADDEIQYEEADIDALIARGRNNDDKALARVTDICLANGWDEDVVDTTSWDDIRPLMTTKKEAEVPKSKPATVEPPKEHVPTVTDFVEYGTNPKGGRRTLCEVKTVNKAKKTVTLVNQADKKTEYKDVPWSKLVYPA